MAKIVHVVEAGQVWRNLNAQVALITKVGHEYVTYLAMRGTELARHKMEEHAFARQFKFPVMKNNERVGVDYFLEGWDPERARRNGCSISSPAAQELAVLSKQPEKFRPFINSTLDNGGSMASAKKGAPRAKKTDGAVAVVRKWLDDRLEKIKAGGITRADVTKALADKGVNTSTISVQTSKWSKENGLVMAGARGNPVGEGGGKAKRQPKAKKEAAQAAA
jgi:hypothetical protein